MMMMMATTTTKRKNHRPIVINGINEREVCPQRRQQLNHPTNEKEKNKTKRIEKERQKYEMYNFTAASQNMGKGVYFWEVARLLLPNIMGNEKYSSILVDNVTLYIAK